MSEGNTKTWPAPCKSSLCFDHRMKQGKFIKPSNMSVSEWKERSGPLHLWDTIWMFFFHWAKGAKVQSLCQYIHERRSQKQTFCRTFLFHMSSCFRRTAILRFFNILRRHSLHIL